MSLFRTLGYPEAVARLLSGLCTNSAPDEILRNHAQDLPPHEGRRLHQLYGSPHLPQGARPTSPALANSQRGDWTAACRDWRRQSAPITRAMRTTSFFPAGGNWNTACRGSAFSYWQSFLTKALRSKTARLPSCAPADASKLLALWSTNIPISTAPNSTGSKRYYSTAPNMDRSHKSVGESRSNLRHHKSSNSAIT